MIFEVFTDSKDESDALFAIRNIEKDATTCAKKLAKNVLGKKGIKFVKKIVGK